MSVPSDDAQLLQTLIDALRSTKMANYGVVSACAFLFYDVILALDREVKYIWRGRWSFPKVAYILIRYYGAAYLAGFFLLSASVTNSVEVRCPPSSLVLMRLPARRKSVSLPRNIKLDFPSCRRYYRFVPLGGPIIFTTIANIILLMRVHALYNRNRNILIFLVMITAGQFSTDLYAAIRISAYDSAKVIPPPLNLPWPGCIVSSSNSRFTLISWIPMLIVATIFFLLTLLNFIRNACRSRNFGSRKRITELWHVSPLLSVFVRDGTLFYFILLVTIIVGMILSTIVQGPSALSSAAWLVAVYSSATARLMLNLREFSDRSETFVTWEQTFSIQIQPSTTEEGSEETQIELSERMPANTHTI
ncbi:hypothetical protein APHAL10511_008519 [Amanita phalloides]|nr:hypothetical protein APHAL10511_008519 [Amanita phalloides]